MQINTDISPFPPCIGGAAMAGAEQSLINARLFYACLTDAPRTIAEALDEYQVQLSAGSCHIVGTDDAPFTETTRQAAEIAVPDLAIIAEKFDGNGHGTILLHSAGEEQAHDAKDLNHRLLLVVWSETTTEHVMADVTKGVRVECVHDYNDEIAARLEPNPDGTFSPPDGQIRYAVGAGEVLPGTRIIFNGRTRLVADCSKNLPATDPESVIIEFYDGSKIIVPSKLEITYVDEANGQ